MRKGHRLSIQDAAAQCHVGEARIYALIRRDLLKAYKQEAGGRSKWWITMTIGEIGVVIERHYPSARKLVFPKVCFHLTDEDCWMSRGSFMAEGKGEPGGYTVVDWEYRCPFCGSADRMEWNGQNYYCECRPWTPVTPEAISKRYESNRFPYPANTTPVQSNVDESYALETKYIRLPAASNLPRGRNDPHINRINEEAPRYNAGYGWIRSRR